MRNKFRFVFWTGFFLFAASVFGQTNPVVNDPTSEEKRLLASAAEQNLIKNRVLPKARKLWSKSEMCDEQFEIAGVAKGAFSRPRASQTLIFYQFCQTGNGLGNNGLVLIESGRIVGSYASEGGWAANLKAVPDINQNNLDEFLVYYSGGMHQGAGGTGVDLMEFSGAGGGIKGLGWFQADSFGEETGDHSFKVSVKPGKRPVFYREKYVSTGENKWRKSGKIAAFKLGQTYGKFTVLK